MNHALILSGLDTNNYGRSSAAQRSAGAHRIATWLRAEDWDVEVIDFVVYWSPDELKELFRSRITSSTVFIGFSATFSVWRDWFNELFAWVKSEYPHVKIISGGPIAGTSRVKSDYYVEGFGEKAISAVVRHILSKEPLKYTLWRDGKKLVRANMDYPSFPMGSLKIKYEDRDFIQANETLTTELGRGCKFACDFCYFPILGVKGDYSRDASDFKEEMLDTYDRFGVTSYMLADETINDRTEKLQKFADVVDTFPFEPYYRGFLRGDLLVSREKDLQYVEGMRLWGHHYGIESLNHESSKCMGKGMNPEKLLPGLLNVRNKLKEKGPYTATMSLIAGLPHETIDTMNAGFEWLHQNWTEGSVIIFPLYIPRKGSGDHESELTDKWESWGYRDMSEEEQAALVASYPKEVAAYTERPWTERGLAWSNEHMNIFDSIKHTNEFYVKYNYWGRPLIWTIGDYKLAYGMSEAEVISQTMRSLRPKQMMLKLTHFVEEYKKKKLSIR